MGLGRAVGAVTCAVDYIEKSLESITKPNCNKETIKLFGGAGGINHDEEYKGKIEAIVIFTSKEVINRKLSAFSYEGCKEPGNVRDEIIKNLKKIWIHSDKEEERKIFWCEVDIDNFQDCFDKVLKVAQRFKNNGKPGKEIWCNLTGGSNSIGYSLLSMAGLTGKSAKHYMLSQAQDYREAITVPKSIKEIRPNKDGYFQLLPFWRTQFAMVDFYEILFELNKLNRKVTTEELLARLQTSGKCTFYNIDKEAFIRNYMMSLYNQGYTELIKDENNKVKEVKISPEGKTFLEDDLTMGESLTLESNLSQTNNAIVDESKNWEWFKEVDNLGNHPKNHPDA